MKAKAKTIFDPRYKAFIAELVVLRKSKDLTQRELAKLFNQPHGFIGRVEIRERRLDLIEAIDLLKAMGLSKAEIVKVIEKIL
ncbi:MAG: helix-turn-helix domain-containing protein [Proteobacteria bacterium]|nr:helix-turn-helix domain-containing protein [Pseudomonadota bacterium]